MVETLVLPPCNGGRAGLSATVVGNRIFLCGGHDGESPMKTLEAFDPGPEVGSPGVWTKMPPMLARRTYPQTVFLDGRIFAIGGSADGRTLNTIEVFDPVENVWTYWFSMPPMQIKRTLHGAAVGNGKIFVCGGFDGTRDMNTVECYEPRTNSWKTTNSWNMTLGRSYFAMCACGGVLYAVGGHDRRNETMPPALQSVMGFDLYSELWLPVADLLTGRIGPTASHLVHADGEDYIYACGGSDGSDVLRTVERYSVRKNTWSPVQPMNTPRCQHAAAVVNNKLYVFGGYDGAEPLTTFECYDPETECWGPLLKMGLEHTAPADLQRQISAEVRHSIVKDVPDDPPTFLSGTPRSSVR